MQYLELLKQSHIKPGTGKLLIAEPFLNDPSFSRTVILLCEHGEEGSIGFVLNQPCDLKLNHFLPEVKNKDITVFDGGPVQKETLHVLHQLPDILGGEEILPGVFWGGSYSKLNTLLEQNKLNNDEVRLYLGYSGWDADQLQSEITEGAWIVAKATPKLVFGKTNMELWKEALKTLGNQFHYMVNTPLHPQYN